MRKPRDQDHTSFRLEDVARRFLSPLIPDRKFEIVVESFTVEESFSRMVFVRRQRWVKGNLIDSRFLFGNSRREYFFKDLKFNLADGS